MRNLNRILMILCLAGSAVMLAACSTCTGRPRIRPIDHAQLPAPRNYGDLPLYRRDIDVDYAEIASIDSVVMPTKDANAVQSMLQDLKAKACAAGADAVVRVKMLEQQKSGFVNNPRTPFCSWKQGEWKAYFFRGTAIKYICRPEGEPAEKPMPRPPKPKAR